MALFLKTSFLELLKSNIKTTNQLRYYARWSHRRPRRVIPPEEFDKIEAKFQKSVELSEREHSESNEGKIIELNAETELLHKPSKVGSVRPKPKWVPKILKTNVGLVNMNELDAKCTAANNKIDHKVAKTKKATYKMVNTNSTKATTDMLETVIDANGDFIYTKLADNDAVVGQLLLTVKSRKEQVKKDLALLEGKRLIKEALEAHCTLKYLIFSRKSDVEFLKPYLPKSGAKLYKMPYKEIQMWSDLTTTPGIMGIFKTPEVHNFVPKFHMPLTVICDNVREPGNLGAILRSAAGVGARNVILTKGCVDLWDTKVLRSACGAHFCLQIQKKMEWSDIRKQIHHSKNGVFIADNKIITENVSESLHVESQLIESTKEQKSLKDIVLSMPLLPYYSVQFNDFSSLALIVGGETAGISEESYRLAEDFGGVRLNIPLSNNVESLNTGTALGIILFEIKRQMLLLSQKDEVEMLIQ